MAVSTGDDEMEARAEVHRLICQGYCYTLQPPGGKDVGGGKKETKCAQIGRTKTGHRAQLCR